MLNTSKEQLRLIVADLQAYIEKKIELKSLEFQEKGAVVAAAAISNLLGIILLVVGLFFLLVTAGLGLGELFGSTTLGFLMLSLLLIIVGSYIYATKRNALKKKLERQISSFLDDALAGATSEMPGDKQEAGQQERSESSSRQHEQKPQL
ncbi:MAG: phage holin family protein [Candidatus Cyclonatronum sp.]|uniref:phage holin family protein n=1 Tax=Cyclonatronum sp. TaxID=3024185 RepID=UPI0025C415EE|nr:phage holin family protein [Cyclonatronum sp.]MCH8487491.1 phage holin family protein [Cyclonatronum sp.]